MPPQSTSDRRIPWWIGPFAFGLLIVLLYSVSVLLRVLVTLTHSEAVLRFAASPAGLGVQVLFMSAVFAAFSIAPAALWQVSPKKWFCLHRVSVATYVVAVMGIVGMGFLVDEVVFVLHQTNPSFFDPAGLDLFNQLFLTASPTAFVLLTIVISLGPGIGEELFFRGLMMRTLLSKAPASIAILLSAILFGLIHFDVLQSPGAALIGVYLGIVALKANSLLPAMVAHGTNNLLCALFARFSDPKAADPLLEGHPWWLLCASALLTISALVFFFSISRPKIETSRETSEDPAPFG